MRRIFAVASVVAAVLVAAAPASNAAEDPVTGADHLPAPQAVIATHNGEQVNLSEGWPVGAISCTEVVAGDVRCYDSAEAELKDLADESIGHAAAALERGMEIPGALDTKGYETQPLREVSPSANLSTQAPAAEYGTVGALAISDCYSGYACLYDWTR